MLSVAPIWILTNGSVSNLTSPHSPFLNSHFTKLSVALYSKPRFGQSKFADPTVADKGLFSTREFRDLNDDAGQIAIASTHIVANADPNILFTTTAYFKNNEISQINVSPMLAVFSAFFGSSRYCYSNGNGNSHTYTTH
jgi:hypothetical protein